MAYSVGQTVYHCSEGKCVVVEFCGTNWINLEEYFVRDAEGTEFYTIGEELSLTPNLPFKSDKDCECGAKYTSFPNFHSDYCVLYKKRD